MRTGIECCLYTYRGNGDIPDYFHEVIEPMIGKKHNNMRSHIVKARMVTDGSDLIDNDGFPTIEAIWQFNKTKEGTKYETWTYGPFGRNGEIQGKHVGTVIER